MLKYLFLKMTCRRDSISPRNLSIQAVRRNRGVLQHDLPKSVATDRTTIYTYKSYYCYTQVAHIQCCDYSKVDCKICRTAHRSGEPRAGLSRTIIYVIFRRLYNNILLRYNTQPRVDHQWTYSHCIYSYLILCIILYVHRACSVVIILLCAAPRARKTAATVVVGPTRQRVWVKNSHCRRPRN